MIDILKNVFNDVYRRVYGEDYVFKNKNVIKNLETFLNKIPSSAGENWLLEYTIFQFSYYSSLKTRFDRVFVNWIYGNKALERWANRTEAQNYFADKYKQSLGIVKELKALPASDWFHTERTRFSDENRQLIHCYENDLFNKESIDCKNCINYEICIKRNV